MQFKIVQKALFIGNVVGVPVVNHRHDPDTSVCWRNHIITREIFSRERFLLFMIHVSAALLCALFSPVLASHLAGSCSNCSLLPIASATPRSPPAELAQQGVSNCSREDDGHRLSLTCNRKNLVTVVYQTGCVSCDGKTVAK